MVVVVVILIVVVVVVVVTVVAEHNTEADSQKLSECKPDLRFFYFRATDIAE